MIGKHNIEEILILSEIVEEIIPKDYQNKYEEKVFNTKMNFIEQFIAYCVSNSFTPKTTDKELLKAEVLGVIHRYMPKKEDKEKFKFEIFDHLFLPFVI